jgi:hypothetical protein
LERAGAARRGAALIIAIIVLASLLMLGLPFIFTQSSSLSGTRSFAHSQSAYINRDAAENVGVAAGSLVVKSSLKGTTGQSGTEQWTSLVDKLVALKGQALNPPMPPGWAVALGDNRVGINMVTMAGFNGTPMNAGGAGQARGMQQTDIRNTGVIGTAIEDEAGKLDVNSLTVAGWDALLKQVGIDDWDDQQAANSRPVLQPNGGYWGIDDDNYGELARALAESRLNLPGRRSTRFDQLLLADTTGAGRRAAASTACAARSPAASSTCCCPTSPCTIPARAAARPTPMRRRRPSGWARRRSSTSAPSSAATPRTGPTAGPGSTTSTRRRPRPSTIPAR